MYRQGLGDCFLLSLPGAGAREFHLMVDCGVILGTPDAADRLRLVLDDVIRTTGGRVDVLVVTHEHYDHVAAFALCRDKFAAAGKREPGKLSVGAVWFAWTEDPGDKLAGQLREQRRRRKEALAGLLGRLDGMGAASNDAAAGVVAALQFFGIDASAAGNTVEKLGVTAQAMANAAGLVAPDEITYWQPGGMWESRDAPGIRVYVLGPPRDPTAFGKSDAATEVYHLDAGPLEEAVRMGAASSTATGGPDRYAPFDRFYRHPLSAAATGSVVDAATTFLAEHYFGIAPATAETDISWRRIDGAWLGSAEQLALALDGATNNTSLVLAIKLVKSGEVLLFAADAQVGSWLSWHGLRWGEGPEAVTTTDLLRRTRFYKVGHHGSRNATLKAKGLEMMPPRSVVAFIPVDQQMAARKRWFEMPLPHLIDALREHCGNAVIRMDEALPVGVQEVSAGGEGGRFGSLYYDWTHAL